MKKPTGLRASSVKRLARVPSDQNFIEEEKRFLRHKKKTLNREEAKIRHRLVTEHKRIMH